MVLQLPPSLKVLMVAVAAMMAVVAGAVETCIVLGITMAACWLEVALLLNGPRVGWSPELRSVVYNCIRPQRNLPFPSPQFHFV